ncbi:hypothetical protein EGC86_02195 [Shewanella frigidimarina]|uniref:phosphoribosyltransferase-like protein n=1 Tax=Shewanella frigidimarina TaxID=56812 RepID=UPI000F4D6BEC|nr:hypothetical protein [Shewanella frigidimarina]RPA64104.1 hypothetical protein EGC86_02195 [Shewanella frigidimarina]
MLLPNNSEAFKIIVIEKIKIYCDTNIWPFEYEQFTAWLNNFDCKIEEYIALQFLDNLIVRSKEMAKASYARLLYGPIRQYLSENTSINVETIPKWKEKLRSGELSKDLRFCPVKLNSDQGESGSTIYRMLSTALDTNRYSLAKATTPPKVIILIDDFIGSGEQFIDFALEFNLEDKIKTTQIIYCPLVGFEIGINHISTLYPKLHILPSEYILKTDSLFYGDDNELFKNDQINTILDVKNFLIGMHKKYASKMPYWFGHEFAGLPLAFEWGCPNQTPSLLYMMKSKKNKNWQQLFSRRS